MQIAIPSTDAKLAVQALLQQAMDHRASDIHLEPTATSVQLRFRLDGMLVTVAEVEPEHGRSMTTRLMVMGQLLTYRQNVPQEGRLRFTSASDSTVGKAFELRIAVMPTIHGLRAAVRLPGFGPEVDEDHSDPLDALTLPENITSALRAFARSDSGMLLLTGPAGSGKTTTIYAMLDHIVQTNPSVSIVSLEDPVERDLPGVTQIEVTPFGELTYDKALRSILRQDPQVLALGEIRDRATASLAVHAALTGHRLVSTLHAGSAAEAMTRLLEMGIEAYQITSCLFGVVSQRLLRRRNGDGYQGRIPVGEFLPMDSPLRELVMRHATAEEMAKQLQSGGNPRTIRQAAEHLCQKGLTDEQEVARVLGGLDDSRGTDPSSRPGDTQST